MWGKAEVTAGIGQCSQAPLPPQVALLETSPYLLALTIIVSIVHSVFEFLAFKNGRHGGPGHQATVRGSICSLFPLCLGSLTCTLEATWA